MELRHLVAFDAVARTTRITGAARELSLSPSVLGRQITALEDELCVRLFHRRGQQITLTRAGREFHAYVQQILHLLRHAQMTIADHRGMLRGELRLAVPPSVSILALPHLLSGFATRYPHLTVTVSELSRPLIRDALLRGDVDVALLADVPDDGQLKAAVIHHDEYVLAVADSHPLRRQLNVTLIDARSEAWILPADETDIRQLTVAACRRAGFSPRIVMQGGTIPTILQCIAAGIGIALLPARVVQHHVGVAGLPIGDQRLTTAVAVVTANAPLPNPAVVVLTRHLMTAAEHSDARFH